MISEISQYRSIRFRPSRSSNRSHEDFVSERWIAHASDLARQTRHHGNFQEADRGANHDAEVESRRGRTSRSNGPWRDEQGRVWLPVRALFLLAKPISGEGLGLGDVRRKFHDRGIA